VEFGETEKLKSRYRQCKNIFAGIAADATRCFHFLRIFSLRRLRGPRSERERGTSSWSGLCVSICKIAFRLSRKEKEKKTKQNATVNWLNGECFSFHACRIVLYNKNISVDNTIDSKWMLLYSLSVQGVEISRQGRTTHWAFFSPLSLSQLKTTPTTM
jgi:hypothetical protein